MRHNSLHLVLCIAMGLGVLAGCSDNKQAPKEDTSQASAPETTAKPQSPEVKAETATETTPPASTDTSPPPEAAPQATEEKTAEPTGQTPLQLAQSSGCMACHKVDSKLVGPAWKDVAKRYKDDPNAKATLIEKVKKGGKGNWTDVTGGVMMPPYSPRVKDQDIEKLVEFVLSLE